MLQAFFHAWERRLASVTTDRVVRPFEWGLNWVALGGDLAYRPGTGDESPLQCNGTRPQDTLTRWVSHIMADTDAFFTPPPINSYELDPRSGTGQRLTFPSALVTPHPANNTVHCRYFPAHSSGPAPSARRKAAVLVLPQWNADADGHVGLCRLLAWNGM